MIAPTLLVGLGGTGSKIVALVSNLASPEQRKKIGFAVFDTDANDLDALKEEYPFVKTIQTSTSLTVGEYLNIDNHARDEWFPVNALLNSKTLTEGAGQVRAISRLALDTAIKVGQMEPLHEAIQDLFQLEENEQDQALRVIIVSSLAGGTGSGLILPVALYIRNHLTTVYRKNANITRGFFILPEVFNEVVTNSDQRTNLRCNAYATLRELDAFLMKGDDTLPERYQDSVKMEFPKLSSAGFEEYHVRPYDFCFLFDAQNSEGSKLSSFNQYLNHAANCIYAQSIGPMNKRSNSSEDNTIRRLCAEKGRNRYAGAGSSMLIYPTEDVKDYISLQWAKESVSEQWLTIDNMYKDLCKRNALMRLQGVNVPDMEPAKHYINTIETLAKDKNPFAKSIINACTIFDETGTRTNGFKWEQYVTNLSAKIQQDEATGQLDLDTKSKDVRDSINNISGGKESWDDFNKAYCSMEEYKNMVIKRTEESANIVAYTMFKAPNDNVTSDKLSHQMETYLRDSKGNFMHPNSVRYFLYKTSDTLEQAKYMVAQKNESSKRYFDDFLKNSFADENSDPDNISIVDKKVGLKEATFNKLSADQTEIRSKMIEYLNKVNTYRYESILELVLQEGIDYVNELTKAFENFYKSFEVKVSMMNKRIAALENKYEYTKGNTARYVCASQTCLQAMLEKMPYTGSVIEIDGALADKIYSKVRKYSMLPTKPTNDSYFSDLFDNGILAYYKDSLMKAYSERIDIDIITAIEEEAKYEQKIFDDDEIELYVKKIITKTRGLSNPFIERPLGEQKDPIFACAFNSDLNPLEELRRDALIDKMLKNAGGVVDDDISKNMILFYQSFYGLRANGLSKFAPPEHSMTSNRTGGEYYKAYFDLIESIHPEPHKSSTITPHIDRWWHVVNKMPDLDDSNQEAQEEKIYSAFFWGLLAKFVDLYDSSADNKIYKLNVDEVNMQDSNASNTLVVSNGTPCDCLYEVLDAISIYPELVNKILEKVDYITTTDVNLSNAQSIEDCELLRFVQNFRIKQYPLDAENSVRSIFDLPILMRKSATPDLYYQEDSLKIVKAELSEIKKYFKRLCSERELAIVMGDLLRDQYKKYLNNVKLEEKKDSNIYQDYLFIRTCTMIANAFEDIGLIADSRAIKREVEDLSK